MRYGGLSEDQALAMITINPARQLNIDHRVGSIEVGKDADLVLFGTYPLSSYAVPEMVLIEGAVYFSREKDQEREKQIAAVKKRLIEAEKGTSGHPPGDKDEKSKPAPTEEDSEVDDLFDAEEVMR